MIRWSRLWGGKPHTRHRSAMLKACWNSSGCCSRPSWPGFARSRHDLVLENLLLRHQLAVLTRPTRTRPRVRLRTWDKLLGVLARRVCAGWREHLAIVTPETVVRWHRQGWRLCWRWKSRSRGGRPHLSSEVPELIATMSRENRLWAPNGAEANCSSLASTSATDPFAATAGVGRRARRARPGALS
jgi:hypothetical protein